MNIKFTKGPWIAYYPKEFISEARIVIEDKEGELICTQPMYKSKQVEPKANAHLIAAAPDLYDTTRMCLDLLSKEILPSDESQAVIDACILALVKARGES